MSKNLTIIQRAAQREKAAMTALYEQQKHRVYFLCRQMLPEEDAEAVAAESFHTLWKKLFRDQNLTQPQLELYLALITARLCRERLMEENPHALDVGAPTEGVTAPDASSLEQVLSALSTRQRLQFLLHALVELTPAQSARVLQIAPDQAEASWQETEAAVTARLEALPAQEAEQAMDMTALRTLVLQAADSETVPEALNRVAMETISALAHPEKKGKKRLGLILTLVLLALLLGVGAFCLLSSTGDGDSSSVASELHHVEIEIEDYGTITVELDASAAPVTVENFLSLAESGFYDGLTFHRIIEGFMMQGGDPNGDGTGGSEETIVGEFSDNGYDNPLSHTRGAISMARSSDYDSASSQFFIVQEDSTSLDGQYAVFGYVTDGMDIVDQICADAEPTDDNGTISAEDQPVITSITVLD